MKKTMDIRSKLALILAFLAIINSFERSSACFYYRKHVHIINKLLFNSPLNLRCQSGDDDLGNHTKYFGEDYKFSFCENIIPTTLFFCHLWWGPHKQKSFDAYKSASQFRNPSQNYYWYAQTDGIYYADDRHAPKLKLEWEWRNLSEIETKNA